MPRIRSALMVWIICDCSENCGENTHLAQKGSDEDLEVNIDASLVQCMFNEIQEC